MKPVVAAPAIATRSFMGLREVIIGRPRRTQAEDG